MDNRLRRNSDGRQPILRYFGTVSVTSFQSLEISIAFVGTHYAFARGFANAIRRDFRSVGNREDRGNTCQDVGSPLMVCEVPVDSET
jgi:hypothetical protein